MAFYTSLLRAVQVAGKADRYGVAQHLGTDSQTAGTLLWRARELGLVERRPVALGATEYHLTPKGRARLAKSKGGN